MASRSVVDEREPAYVLTGHLPGSEVVQALVDDAQRRFKVAQMYAGMFSLALLGYLLNQLFDLVYRWLLAWHWGMMRGKDEG